MGPMSITSRERPSARSAEAADATRVIVADDDARAGATSRLADAVHALPDGTLRAAGAGVEAGVLTWLCAVVPAVAAYVATAALPALGEATWVQAAAAGTVVWRLAHGATVELAGTTVGLAPLGLSLLAGALVTFALRRAQVLTWAGVAATVVGYVGAAAVLGLVGPPGARGASEVLAGAAVISLVGGVVAVRRGRGALPPVTGAARAWLDRVPGAVLTAVTVGLRAAGLLLGGLLGLGVVLTVVSLVANHAGFSARLADLRIDGLSTGMLMLASVFLLPTLVVWAVAWVTGPGFVVGDGTLYAPGDVVVGPVPALPALAGLPAPGTVAADVAWAPLAVVALGLGVGWWVHRRLSRPRPPHRVWVHVAAGLVGVLGCVAVVWLLTTAASGSVGPGTMTQVGPDPSAVARATALEVGLGVTTMVVLAHPSVIARARRGLGRVVTATRQAVRARTD